MKKMILSVLVLASSSAFAESVRCTLTLAHKVDGVAKIETLPLKAVADSELVTALMTQKNDLNMFAGYDRVSDKGRADYYHEFSIKYKNVRVQARPTFDKDNTARLQLTVEGDVKGDFSFLDLQCTK